MDIKKQQTLLNEKLTDRYRKMFKPEILRSGYKLTSSLSVLHIPKPEEATEKTLKETTLRINQMEKFPKATRRIEKHRLDKIAEIILNDEIKDLPLPDFFSVAPQIQGVPPSIQEKIDTAFETIPPDLVELEAELEAKGYGIVMNEVLANWEEKEEAYQEYLEDFEEDEMNKGYEPMGIEEWVNANYNEESNVTFLATPEVYKAPEIDYLDTPINQIEEELITEKEVYKETKPIVSEKPKLFNRLMKVFRKKQVKATVKKVRKPRIITRIRRRVRKIRKAGR